MWPKHVSHPPFSLTPFEHAPLCQTRTPLSSFLLLFVAFTSPFLFFLSFSFECQGERERERERDTHTHTETWGLREITESQSERSRGQIVGVGLRWVRADDAGGAKECFLVFFLDTQTRRNSFLGKQNH
jgi:hypothetical protein